MGMIVRGVAGNPYLATSEIIRSRWKADNELAVKNQTVARSSCERCEAATGTVECLADYRVKQDIRQRNACVDDIMKTSTQRILTTHTGSLHRPKDLEELYRKKLAGEPYD